jgi:hypothetical protein
MFGYDMTSTACQRSLSLKMEATDLVDAVQNPVQIHRWAPTGNKNVSMDIDGDKRQKAVERLRALGGLSEEGAGGLVDAALAGAVDHAFELVNGSGPVPTAMTTSKADQLRWICERAGRLVSQREVEILFRITATSARSILNTMLATYEEGLRAKFLDRMRRDATVLRSGSNETGLTWTLRFTEPSTFDAAWSELARLGLLSQCEPNSSQRKIIVPRNVQMNGKTTEVLDALGLESPE